MLKRAFQALKSPVTAGVDGKDEEEADCVDETGVDIAEALEILHSHDNLENKDLSEKEIRVFDTEDGKETREKETKLTGETKLVTKPADEIQHTTKSSEETKLVTKPLDETTKHVSIKKPHFDVESLHSPTVGDLAKVVEMFFQKTNNIDMSMEGCTNTNLLDLLHAELRKQSAKQHHPVRRRTFPRPCKPLTEDAKRAIARGRRRLAQHFVIDKLTLPQINPVNTPHKNKSFNEQIKQFSSSNLKRSKLSFEEYFSVERQNEICLYFCGIFNQPCFDDEVTVVVSIRNFNILVIDNKEESKELFRVSIKDIEYIQILDNLQEIRIISPLSPLPLCFPTRKICGDFLSSVEYLVRTKTPRNNRLLQHEPPRPLLTKPIIQSFLVNIRATNPGLALQRIGTFMYSAAPIDASSMSSEDPVDATSICCSSSMPQSTNHSAIAVSTDAPTNITPNITIKWNPGNFFVKAGALYVYGVEENLLPVISQKLARDGCSLHEERSSSERPHIVEVVLQDGVVLHVATSQDEQAAWLKEKIEDAANFVQEDVANTELVSCELVISSLEFGCFIHDVSNHNHDFECFICNDSSHTEIRAGDETKHDNLNNKMVITSPSEERDSNIVGVGEKSIDETSKKKKTNSDGNDGGVHFIWRILISNIHHLHVDKNHSLAKITTSEESGCENVSMTFPGQEELAAFASLVKDLNVEVLANNNRLSQCGSISQ